MEVSSVVTYIGLVCDPVTLMMMTDIEIEASVYYVSLTRLIAREDIKFTRRESTKTYID
jgi:hypothetical protein